MKVISQLRRFAPVAALVAAVALLASCATSSKYGCPNHVNQSSHSHYAR